MRNSKIVRILSGILVTLALLGTGFSILFLSKANQLVIEDVIEINAPPEKVYDFFLSIDKNYKVWHPQDHLSCTWIKGKPLEQGSEAHFEEYVGGELVAMDVLYTTIIPNQEIEFIPTNFVQRLFYPKSTLSITRTENGSTFIAKTYVRMGFLANSSGFTAQLDVMRQHMREEGQYLKSILEQE